MVCRLSVKVNPGFRQTARVYHSIPRPRNLHQTLPAALQRARRVGSIHSNKLSALGVLHICITLMCQLHSRDQITDRVCTWAYQIEKLHLLFTPRERDGGVSARRWRADTGIGDVILLFWSACLLFPLLLLSWLLSKLYQVPILYTPFLRRGGYKPFDMEGRCTNPCLVGAG
ncbi:uncharacterized protein MCYG_00267 [Microsporum canis CBS 113480]|uniref:Uncharacterized protein n=1 Tax=Arthroderma otae (strain ATCC MYA-4605 / CBS 113480) TaxID=554155 RepID=C5FCD5_ARTOC|nr:uncharacterized protein MCYG_00267 [Microsporum canis CBS 113480]EEQ27379.1 hypothetical protein MCYG_00267 [Microsporum canis CBS 113480]